MNQIWNLPNILTIFRIAIIPVLVVVFYLPFAWSYSVSAFLFALACVTDWFDGFLARKLHLESPFGAFLDPVADKLLVAVILILLVAEQGSPLLAMPASVIVGREIVISALREWMAEVGNRQKVAVSKIAKWKTGVQMVAITVLLMEPATALTPLLLAGYLLIYIAAGLTLWSMMVYLSIAWKELTKS